MLLAYDGSPKADEALFVAAYQASRWGHALTVLTVETQQTKPSALRDARTYLEEHDVHHANYILKSAPIGEAILETAAEEGSNTIIMGGFGARPVVHLLRGSAVEYVLQHAVSRLNQSLPNFVTNKYYPFSIKYYPFSIAPKSLSI